MPIIGDWVQPPEDTSVTLVVPSSALLKSWDYSDYATAWPLVFPGAAPGGPPGPLAGVPLILDIRSDEASPGTATVQAYLALLSWTYPQVPPDPLPDDGWVEYEATVGEPVDDQAEVFVDATMHGTEDVAGNGLSVRRVDEADRASTWLTPSDLGGYTELAHLTAGDPVGGDVRSDDTGTVTVDGDDHVAIAAVMDGHVIGVPPQSGRNAGVQTWWAFTASRQYLPPRYRIITGGGYPLRQRQRPVTGMTARQGSAVRMTARQDRWR